MGNFNAESAGHNNRPIQHVHEVIGSTFIAERCNDPHNHRIAAVSGKAIPFMDSHVHNSRSVLIPMTDIIMNFAVLPLPLSRLETADMCILQKHIPHMQTDMHMNSDWLR